MHIHIGHNVPGYLPESDVWCFDALDGAVSALQHDLKDRQDYYYEGCDSDGAEGCECAWCSVATDVEAVLSAIADGDVQYRLRVLSQDFYQVFGAPEGPDMAHWATLIEGDRTKCEIAQEQDD